MPAPVAPGAKTGWWEKETDNMVTIKSIQHFVDLLASAGDKLVIVEFYGKWCGACKGVYPKLCKIIEGRDDIIVAKIDFDENKPIAKAMNVRVLPFFVFYRGADGKLDAFSASLVRVCPMPSPGPPPMLRALRHSPGLAPPACP